MPSPSAYCASEREHVDVGAGIDEDLPRLRGQRAAVVGVVGADELVLGQRIEQGRSLRP